MGCVALDGLDPAVWSLGSRLAPRRNLVPQCMFVVGSELGVDVGTQGSLQGSPGLKLCRAGEVLLGLGLGGPHSGQWWGEDQRQESEGTLKGDP